jgi:hypothetical protein
MKLIALTQDQFALVDDDLYEEINKFSWYCATIDTCRYAAKAVMRPNGRKAILSMQNYVMILKGIYVPPGSVVDHENCNGLDNQYSNLRIATESQNAANKRNYTVGISGYHGVAYHRKSKKFRAIVQVHGKKHQIGIFTNAEEAARARDKAAKELQGEYAVLNFPDEVTQPSLNAEMV